MSRSLPSRQPATAVIDLSDRSRPDSAGRRLADTFDDALRVLIVEDNDVDALVVRRNLLGSGPRPIRVDRVDRLSEALITLAAEHIDCVLLDLDLPDSQGLETVDAVLAVEHGPAVVVLTGRDSRHLALKAVAAGAQDYLTKDDLNAPTLVRSLTYAIARHVRARELRRRADELVETNRRLREAEALQRDLAEHDALTGVLTRRAFESRVGVELRFHRALGARLALLFCDVDDFKRVNDELGHHVGDQVLEAVADRLQASVRHADLVGRVGGDEFLVLFRMVRDEQQVEELATRLLEQLSAPIEAGDHRVPVALSMGIVVSDAFEPLHEEATVTSIMELADAAMYEAKTAGGGRWTRAKGSGVTLDLRH